jgi:hypothetical protein
MELKCKVCKKEYQSSPVILPCGWTVCESHVNNNEIAQCPYCGKAHFSDDGTQYHVNRTVEVHLNQKKLKDGITRADFKLTYFKVLQSDPHANYIAKYFDSLIAKITARENELLDAVRGHFAPMVEKLKGIRDRTLVETDQETLAKFKEIDLEPYAQLVVHLKEAKVDEIKVEPDSDMKQLDAQLKENRKVISEIERALDESLDGLLENTTYELSDKMKMMDLDELYGKLIIKNKSRFFFISMTSLTRALKSISVSVLY